VCAAWQWEEGKNIPGTPLLLTFLLSAVNTEEEKDMMRTKNKNTADSF
jgi:hypothetical protein